MCSNDATWGQTSWPKLVQVMVCYIMARSHHRNQCCLIVYKIRNDEPHVKPFYSYFKYFHSTESVKNAVSGLMSQIARFMGPTWGPPGSCRPQIGPMVAPWTLLSGVWNWIRNIRQIKYHLYGYKFLSNSFWFILMRKVLSMYSR